ncbi:hypothetical protein BRC81_05825 [Halobacteriales archaeon QS_1_68_20]|nr:MAG: hypothetical protein BRC81_05825 [Halobacteriales archaeon QS_1_68_20]
MELNLDPRNLGRAEGMTFFGAVLAVVGSVLPWATLMNNSINGLEANGVVTLGLGLLVAAIALFRIDGRVVHASNAFIGVFIFVVGLETYWNMGTLGLMVWPGWGLYATMASAAFIVTGGAIGFSSFTVQGGNAEATT